MLDLLVSGMREGPVSNVAARALCVGVVLSLIGCGDGRPSLVEATGVVNLDGKPLEGATIYFEPKEVDIEGYGRPSVARTDAQGKFSMGTYGPGTGVPTGTYAVGIEKKQPVGGKFPDNYNYENPAMTPHPMELIVPRAYNDPGSSGLTAEVSSSGLEPAVFNLETGGVKPEIERPGARRANEP